jgi:hypothetical protein
VWSLISIFLYPVFIYPIRSPFSDFWIRDNTLAYKEKQETTFFEPEIFLIGNPFAVSTCDRNKEQFPDLVCLPSTKIEADGA